MTTVLCRIQVPWSKQILGENPTAFGYARRASPQESKPFRGPLCSSCITDLPHNDVSLQWYGPASPQSLCLVASSPPARRSCGRPYGCQRSPGNALIEHCHNHYGNGDALSPPMPTASNLENPSKGNYMRAPNNESSESGQNSSGSPGSAEKAAEVATLLSHSASHRYNPLGSGSELTDG